MAIENSIIKYATKQKQKKIANENLTYIKNEVQSDPSSIRLRVKLVSHLLDEILSFEHITTIGELSSCIEECEEHLVYLGNTKPSPNDKLNYFVKYLSYIQLGMLKALQGDFENAVRYMHRITEYVVIKSKNICLPSYSAPKSLNGLHAATIINIIHLSRYVGADESSERLLHTYSTNIERYINDRVEFCKVQLAKKDTTEDMVQYYEKELSNITGIISDSNLLIFCTFFSDNIVEFYDNNDIKDSILDYYSCYKLFYHIEDDIVNGIYRFIFKMDDESKKKQKKIIQAFL